MEAESVWGRGGLRLQDMNVFINIIFVFFPVCSVKIQQPLPPNEFLWNSLDDLPNECM